MSRPPYNPYDRTIFTNPTWTGIAVMYAMMAAIPLFLWAVSAPVAAGVLLTTVGVLTVAGRRAKELRDCLADCGGFTVDLFGRVEVTVSQPSNCTTC